MTREVACLIIGWGIGFATGIMMGSSHVQSKWDVEKIAQQQKIIEQQDHIKRLEIDHQIQQNEIISEFEGIKRNYENTIHSVISTHSDSLREHEARADIYRQKYQQCNSLVERTVQLDRAITQGIGLVEELEATIKHKDSGIIARDKIIANDRLLINSK